MARTGLEAWASSRWQRRVRDGFEQLPRIDIVRTIEIAGPPEAVWDLIHPAETSAELNDNVIGGFTVPGTPRGQVGERQCFVFETDKGKRETLVAEVVELDPGHRAVTMLVPDNGLRTTSTLAGDENRSILTVRLTCAVMPADVESTRALVEAQYDRYLERVRDRIESGPRGKSDPDPDEDHSG